MGCYDDLVGLPNNKGWDHCACSTGYVCDRCTLKGDVGDSQQRRDVKVRIAEILITFRER